jgi:membrane fusion protein (multidrug efflux system)
MRSIFNSISIFLIVVLAACQQEKTELATAPPPQVSVIVTQSQEIAIPIEFVGQVYGKEDIAIRARVEGLVEGIHFEEG